MDEKTIIAIILCLAEGMSIRDCARVKGVNKDTVQRILERARQHCEKVLSALLKDLHLTECQLDELWSFIKAIKVEWRIIFGKEQDINKILQNSLG